MRLRDGVVTIRPIAGTRQRDVTPEEDDALADELGGDAKERAEHLMCSISDTTMSAASPRPASVRVTDSFFIERYSI